MQQDLQDFLDALRAKNWIFVFIYGVKLAGDIAALLGPHPVVASTVATFSAVSATDLNALTQQLTTEAANVGKINWGNVLALILKILPLILPFIKP